MKKLLPYSANVSHMPGLCLLDIDGAPHLSLILCLQKHIFTFFITKNYQCKTDLVTEVLFQDHVVPLCACKRMQRSLVIFGSTVKVRGQGCLPICFWVVTELIIAIFQSIKCF